MNDPIVVSTQVPLGIEIVWSLWNEPEHIVHWYYGSDEWHTPHATNHLQTGGEFAFEMKPKKGGEGFTFAGRYTHIIEMEIIEYQLDDGRKVRTVFSEKGDTTEITTAFEAEGTFPREMQQEGWQNILNHFRAYCLAYIQNGS